MGYSFVPTLSLALFDLIPCILYVIAYIYLLRYTRRNTSKLYYYILLIGLIIVEIGALSKVTWKLLNATLALNVIELSDYAMYFISAGTFLTFLTVVNLAVVEKNRINNRGTTLYSFAYIPVIILLTLSTCGYLILLIMLSITRESKISVRMFIIYLVLTLTMAGFTPAGYTEIVHWICEGINVIGTGALAIGMYHLDKKDYLMKNKKA